METGDTICFERPALFRYTYNEKEKIKEIYEIGNYTFDGENCLPRLFWKDAYDNVSKFKETDVLCGDSVKPDFYVWNSWQDQLSLIKRTDLTLTFDYPYEV